MNLRKALFKSLKNQGLFWSYSASISYEDLPDSLIIEQALRYADWQDLLLLFKAFPKQELLSVWRERVMADKRLIKQNLFIARVLFGLHIEAADLLGLDYVRDKKLRLLTS